MCLSRKFIALLVVITVGCAVWAQARPKKGTPAPPARSSTRNDCLGYAQHPELRPDAGTDNSIPTVTFRLEMPTFNPTYYGIAIESDGRAAYQSQPQATPEGGSAEPYMVKFTASPATGQRVFELARQANFFQGDFDYQKGKIANTGAKTLSYADADRCNQTTYNWSENPAIDQLTTVFQNISTTMEFGRRLAFLHRFDKLGLDAELKSLEEAVKGNRLAEVQAIAPVLQSIAADYGVMHLARARAERVLAKVPK